MSFLSPRRAMQIFVPLGTGKEMRKLMRGRGDWGCWLVVIMCLKGRGNEDHWSWESAETILSQVSCGGGAGVRRRSSRNHHSPHWICEELLESVEKCQKAMNLQVGTRKVSIAVFEHQVEAAVNPCLLTSMPKENISCPSWVKFLGGCNKNAKSWVILTEKLNCPIDSQCWRL